MQVAQRLRQVTNQPLDIGITATEYSSGRTPKAPRTSPHRKAASYDQADSSWEVSTPFPLVRRPPASPSPPPLLNTTKRDLRQRHNEHYFQTMRVDPRSGNANPINFEIKRRMKSRREAHHVNSTSESSTRFDSTEGFWSSFASE